MHGKQDLKYTGRKKKPATHFINDDFQSIGKNLLESFKKFNDIEKILQKEYNNGGWLKKITLNKLTGKTAREKLELEARLNVKDSIDTTSN
jgi:hypothetical protein